MRRNELSKTLNFPVTHISSGFISIDLFLKICVFTQCFHVSRKTLYRRMKKDCSTTQYDRLAAKIAINIANIINTE